MTAAFIAGFALGATLIIAIGAQNAFILRQGLKREHVFVLCLICAASDAVLIAAGVAGLGSLISGAPLLITLITAGGAVFLLIYGAMAFRRALHPHAMQATDANRTALWPAVMTVLAFTWLNPHVYLDTVVLLGGLSARYQDAARLSYGAGAVVASFVWFFALGYGARMLAPVFARPRAWQVLDVVIGAIMWLIAARLLAELL